MADDKTSKTNAIELVDQDLDQVQGGHGKAGNLAKAVSSDNIASIKTTYTLFSPDGTPVRSTEDNPESLQLSDEFKT